MFDNRTCNRTQNGRSMLEMLAVLGLVAVLTLTALFGYRYAMATAKSQRAFKDVMLRSAAIASSATFYSEANGPIKPPMGFMETSGGMTFDHYKRDAESYSIGVSSLNDLACQKLLDMDYQETPVKGIALNAGEFVSVDSLSTAKLAYACADSGNTVTYYFDRTSGLIGDNHGGGGGGGNNPALCGISCDMSIVKVCTVEAEHDPLCGCPTRVRWADKGTDCYDHGQCDGKGTCICLPGYYLAGEKCLPCDANYYSLGGTAGKAQQCIPCPANAHSPAGSSICICDDPKAQWDSKTNTCWGACSADSDCIDPSYPSCYKENGATVGVCICKGFHGPNSCVACNESHGAVWEKSKAKWLAPRVTGCTCTNQEKKWYPQTNVCRCAPDTYFDGTHCVDCGADSHRPHESPEKACICNDESLVWDPASNSCDRGRPCSTDNDCEEPYPTCYKEGNETTGVCICKGFHGPDSCIGCNEKEGAVWEKSKAKWLSPRLTGCTCTNQEKKWYAQTNVCRCAPDSYFNGTHCIPCGKDSHRPHDAPERACICNDESLTWHASTNSCGLKTCSTDDDCDQPYPTCYKEGGAETGICICEGFHGPDSCIPCNASVGAKPQPDKTKWLSPSLVTGCVCEPSDKKWYHQTNDCRCEPDSYFDGAHCVMCGLDSHRPHEMPQDACICDDESKVWDRETNSCVDDQFCNTDDDCKDPAYPTCYQIPDVDEYERGPIASPVPVSNPVDQNQSGGSASAQENGGQASARKICVCIGWHDEQGEKCLACNDKNGAHAPKNWIDWLYKPRMSGCVCPENSKFENGKCVCDEGYVWNPTTRQCDSKGTQGKGCDDKAFLNVACNGTPSVSGKAGDAVITVSYCAVGKTPGDDGKGFIKGTFKTIKMYRQKQKNGGEFYAGGTATNWYDTQIICNVMKKANSGFQAPSETTLRQREGCKHPRRVRAALKKANSNLSGAGTPRRVWTREKSTTSSGKCEVFTIDVRRYKVQNEYWRRKLNANENTFVAGTYVYKAGGKKIFVDGGSTYPVCYHNISKNHCGDDSEDDAFL